MLGLSSARRVRTFNRCVGAFAVASLFGCSAIVSPDPRRLGDDPDSAIRLIDSGPVVRPDTGPPVPIDGGSCVDGATRCVGDALYTCAGGREVTQDCRAMLAYCASGECQPWVCDPATTECSLDLRSSIQCDVRGMDATEMECGDGVCDPSTGRCSGIITPGCPGVTTMGIGDSRTVDLCARRDASTYQRTTGCGAAQRADVGDVMFAFDVATTTSVIVELSDDDSGAAIDTVVYLRRACDDASTQVACDDDVTCAESTIGGPCAGVEVRQSRFRTTLAPGRYYVVADAFEYSRDGTSYTCGRVRLRVTAG